MAALSLRQRTPQLPRVPAVGAVPAEVRQSEPDDANRVGCGTGFFCAGKRKPYQNTPAFSIADFAPHIADVEREAANEPIKLEDAMRTRGDTSISHVKL